MSPLSAKELLLLSELHSLEGQTSQRALSVKTSISVGLINAVIKKLVKNGYVRAQALNRQKVRYILTPRGTAQIIKRSYHSFLNTIKHYQELENQLFVLLTNLLNSGHQDLRLHGDNALSDTIRRIARSRLKGRIRILQPGETCPEEIILNLTDSPLKGKNTINIFGSLNAPEGIAIPIHKKETVRTQ